MDDAIHQETMKDVRARVVDIQTRLEERNLSDHDLLIRQAAILELMQYDLAEMKDDSRKSETEIDARVRVLEQAYWKIMGAAALAGAVAGFIAKFIGK